jgi:hypothetical protein
MALRQHTPQQYLDAVIAAGGSRIKAAEAMGVSLHAIWRNLKTLKEQGVEIPESPYNTGRAEYMVRAAEDAHHAAPEHFHVKGVSTLYGPEGDVVQQWVKTDQDAFQRHEMLRAAAEALKEEIPRQAPIHVSTTCLEKLCNLYTITDFHIGMLAWRHEGGADWDLQIAEKTLTSCFSHMVMNSPPAKYAVVNQLGDFLHTDGFLPLTPASKHVLDADSRFPKIVQVAVRSLRSIVNMALTRHEHVHVLMAEGNHDPASSVWLRALFMALYENEPRVTVEDSPLPYYAYQHGKTMLAFHHGHMKKADKVGGVIPAQFPKMWGETTKRYVHTGHLHHTHEKEDAGITVIQHPTLAARDAYAARGPWHAERAAKCITYHTEYGEVGRNIVTPEMVA